MTHAMLGTFMTLSLLATSATGALAGPMRVARTQQERITRGVARGALTAGEAKQLELEQERIARARELALSDGSLSSTEALRLQAERRRAGRHIADLARNGLRARR
jgi:hypothetical protein